MDTSYPLGYTYTMPVYDQIRSALNYARTVALRVSKRARRVRDESEFSVGRLRASMRSPSTGSATYAWDLAAIMSARDEQLAGRFTRPARLSEAMRTDDAIHVAQENRLAPAQMIGVEIRPAKGGARAGAIAAEADALFGAEGFAIARNAINSVRLDYIDSGVGVGVLHWTPRDDGSRVDVELRHWPIEHVWWDDTARCLMTRVDTTAAPTSAYGMPLPYDPGPARVGNSGIVPIIHGDGRWVVFQKHDTLAWRKQAAILAACMVWARHAFAGRDWAKGSASHGNAKVVGELPEGVPLQAKDEDGNPIGISDEAQEFLDLLVDIASLDAPVGIKPYGSNVDYITNSSRAWEVWRELMTNAERSAARIYLGTDGTLGAQGGAPGVDVHALFGVAQTRVESDLRCERDAIRTGVIEPWAAINFGDSSLAPSRVHLMPDADADADRESFEKRVAAFWAAIHAALQASAVIDPDYVEDLAQRYGVPVPASMLVPPAPTLTP